MVQDSRLKLLNFCVDYVANSMYMYDVSQYMYVHSDTYNSTLFVHTVILGSDKGGAKVDNNVYMYR